MCFLCSLGKLLHKGNAVLKADLRFVPFAAAPARLIVQRDDPKLHSKAIDVLAGLFPFHKIVAGAGGKAGLIGQLAGAVENPGFVFPVNVGGAGLALLGTVQPLFFVGSGVLFGQGPNAGIVYMRIPPCRFLLLDFVTTMIGQNAKKSNKTQESFRVEIPQNPWRWSGVRGGQGGSGFGEVGDSAPGTAQRQWRHIVIRFAVGL